MTIKITETADSPDVARIGFSMWLSHTREVGMVARSKPYSALIADDDPDFREALRLVLEPFLRTVEAQSGEEAIEIVQQRPVDIILIDMHMHVLTGLETVRIVKRFHAKVPCILITSDATDELRRAAQLVAAYTVLKKPVTRLELVTTISTALIDAYSDPEPLPRRGHHDRESA